MTTPALIYKILDGGLWHASQQGGSFSGAPVDLADGYIHLSTAEQVAETAARHFAHQNDLVLLALDPDAFPSGALKWEASRGGALFPHLYAEMPVSAVRWAKPLPWRDGRHVFPELA